MATQYHDEDADLSIIQGKKVAVIGYGSQGHAHALSLRDSGVDVRIGLADGSASKAKAEAEGLRVLSVADAVKESDVVMLLAPDHVQRHIYNDSIKPNLKPGSALFFGHGFNIRFGYIKPEANIDDFPVPPLPFTAMTVPMETSADLCAGRIVTRHIRPYMTVPHSDRCT